MRSHEQFLFGKDHLSHKLWQNICVHTLQQKLLKKLRQRIFVNVISLLLCSQLSEHTRANTFVRVNCFHKCQQTRKALSRFPRRYCESLYHRVNLCGIHVMVKSNILSYSFSLSHHLHVLQHKNEIIGVNCILICQQF